MEEYITIANLKHLLTAIEPLLEQSKVTHYRLEGAVLTLKALIDPVEACDLAEDDQEPCCAKSEEDDCQVCGCGGTVEDPLSKEEATYAQPYDLGRYRRKEPLL